MTKGKPGSGMAFDGHLPGAARPGGLGKEQAGHVPTTSKGQPGPTPNQGSGGKKK
jgi:hypothetical protein